MGSSSSKTADSVSQARTADSVRQEINQIIIKLRDARQRLKAEEDNDKKNIIIREINLLVSTQASLTDEYDKLAAVAPAGAAAVLAPAAAAAAAAVAPAAAAASVNTPNTQPIYNARNAQGPQDGSPQPDLSGFEYGGTIKRKNSKRKNSKRKNSKRKNSKRKNSKRKNSKRK
jgi:hypothetical protein